MEGETTVTTTEVTTEPVAEPQNDIAAIALAVGRVEGALLGINARLTSLEGEDETLAEKIEETREELDQTSETSSQALDIATTALVEATSEPTDENESVSEPLELVVEEENKEPVQAEHRMTSVWDHF